MDGQGDQRIQAYNFRLCLTDVPENRVPFPSRPATIRGVTRLLLATSRPAGRTFSAINAPMPNRKTDTNNHGAFSTDDIGMNYDYPEADYATREKIAAEHATTNRG